jgi:hypothetical protein
MPVEMSGQRTAVAEFVTFVAVLSGCGADLDNQRPQPAEATRDVAPHHSLPPRNSPVPGVAQIDDPCLEGPKAVHACSSDFDADLVCKNGKFVIERVCRGPKKCQPIEPTIACDDSLGDVGDPCLWSAEGANFACSMDAKNELECDNETRKFRVAKPCRGARGCYVADGQVHCDISIARAGEPCRPANNRACSDDGRSELRCLPDLTWAHHRDCPKEGCAVPTQTHEILCR